MDGTVTPVSEAGISSAEFLSADALFFATTAGGLVPVMRVNKTKLGKDAIGPITAQVLKTYWDWHQRDALIEKITWI